MWTKFDHANVGTKTRHYNRQLYVQGIEPTWTPIKPVATRIVQVVRKQLSLRPATAKTIHRSQGDTKTRVVVNFNTRKANLHTPYLGLSRVTTIESLHTTDLCEHKITYNSDVEKGMERLRNDAKWDLFVSPVNNADQRLLTLCYLNKRSSHRHIEDVHKDLNYFNTDVNIFSETRFSHSGNDSMYSVDGCSLFRNGATPLVIMSDHFEEWQFIALLIIILVIHTLAILELKELLSGWWLPHIHTFLEYITHQEYLYLSHVKHCLI